MSFTTDLLWRPRAVCASLADWHATDPGALDRDRIAGVVALAPAPDGAAYVAELRGAKIVGGAKLVATAHDTVLGDLQFLYGSPDPARHWVLKQRRLRRPVDLGGTSAIVAASNAENYYHWLFDSLPRLHLLALGGHPPAQIDHLLLDERRQPFQTQSLAHLGIDGSRLRQCAKRVVLRCERLLVPSMPGPLGFPPRWVCDFLRSSFWPREASAARRRIYLSRSNARGRKILNEADILPLLQRRGYDVVHAERLSFIEQVDLFASAAEIVTMHGAGLSNIVFARPGARVLELGSPQHTNESFKTVARNCDLHYRHLYLDAAPDGGADTRFANVVADPRKFETALSAFSA